MSWCLGHNSIWLSTTILDCFIPSLFIDIYVLFLDPCMVFSNISLMDLFLLTVYQMSSAHVIILNCHLYTKNLQTHLSSPDLIVAADIATSIPSVKPQKSTHTNETYLPRLYHYGFSFLNDDITQLYLEATLTTVSSFSFHLSLSYYYFWTPSMC